MGMICLCPMMAREGFFRKKFFTAQCDRLVLLQNSSARHGIDTCCAIAQKISTVCAAEWL